MSGWDALVAHEQRAYDPCWAWEAYKARNPRMNAYNGPVLRSVWADAVRWVLAAQMDWPALEPQQQIAELRLGERSIFFPQFADDPKVRLECPRDGYVTVGAEAICDRCLFDFSR